MGCQWLLMNQLFHPDLPHLPNKHCLHLVGVAFSSWLLPPGFEPNIDPKFALLPSRQMRNLKGVPGLLISCNCPGKRTLFCLVVVPVVVVTILLDSSVDFLSSD
jgi:hypothetical protein